MMKNFEIHYDIYIVHEEIEYDMHNDFDLTGIEFGHEYIKVCFMGNVYNDRHRDRLISLTFLKNPVYRIHLGAANYKFLDINYLGYVESLSSKLEISVNEDGYSSGMGVILQMYEDNKFVAFSEDILFTVNRG